MYLAFTNNLLENVILPAYSFKRGFVLLVQYFLKVNNLNKTLKLALRSIYIISKIYFSCSTPDFYFKPDVFTRSYPSIKTRQSVSA